MRLLPRISQPTLESFRRDVYRPRLALLLLILLLNGIDSPGTILTSTRSSSPSSALSSSIATSASSPVSSPADSTILHGKASAWLNWAKSELPFGFLETRGTDKSKDSEAKRQKATPKGAAKTTPAAPVLKKDKSQGKQKAAASTTSPFQMSTLSIENLFQTKVLTAIVPLHMLWLIRLGGMMIEDSIVKSHPHTRAGSGGRSQATSLAAIIGLAFLAIAVPFVSSSQIFIRAMSLFRDSTSDQRSVLPIRIILLLELSATLLSLLCPLMKLNNPTLSRYLPSKVLLPSPSHSPPIVELLPLPPGLADIISGRASNVQYRDRLGGGRARRNMGGGRPGAAGLVLGAVRHGGLPAATTTDDAVVGGGEAEGQDQRNPARWINGMQAPLTLPENASSPSDGTTPLVKAPRRTGVKVEVDSSWLLENVVILWGFFVGAVEYLLVVISLPTLTPASFPPVVALLSLRSQISAMTLTWTSSRRAVECLEFVRRRWATTSASSSVTARDQNNASEAGRTAAIPSSSSPTSTNRRWQPDQQDDVSCPICFELIRSSSSSSQDTPDDRVGAESCRLDCGHELHAVCLVQIFLGNKQAYCPCCHDPLKATPPTNAQQAGGTT